ncbi:MAG TPA: signal peptidase I [Mycobacteriales bacterium]|jgi:signal peptidase I|nr:signal peptidase I [Mycobacteriales bacterium]
MNDEATGRPNGERPHNTTEGPPASAGFPAHTASAGSAEPSDQTTHFASQPSDPAGSPPTGQAAGGPEVAGQAVTGPAAAGQTDADKSLSKFRRRSKHGGGRKRSSFWRELPVLLVVAIVLAVLIKSFLVQAFFIPSASMEKTLHGCTGCSGDRVLVNKLTYRFHDPKPGDIVVFQGPTSWQETPEVQVSEPSNVVSKFFRAIGQAVGVAQPSEKDFVKRVIAVGGQTVACCDAHGNVTVNNRSLSEPYIYENSPDVNSTQCASGRKFGPYTIPKGRLWVMGDHRGDSADSRCHVTDSHRGTIGVDDVIGKAFVTVWPPSRWRTLGTPPTFKDDDSAVGDQTLLIAPLLVGTVATAPLLAWRRRRRRR